MVEEGEGLIFESSEFRFDPPPPISRAQQILIKPLAGYPLPYPVTVSPTILEKVIGAIREVSDADIIFLEGSPREEPMASIYRTLSYDFPRVQMLDVRDCVLVEVENPLPRPFALSTFWLPNLVLYCDYLISICPLKTCGGQGSLSVKNLLGLLPAGKYRGESEFGWGALYNLGIHKVIADLYFTLPFDLGIIDGEKVLRVASDPTRGEEESYGKVFIGEPSEVDRLASEDMGIETEYVTLIEAAKTLPQI